MNSAPQVIYLIRHGEKPDENANPPTTGVDSAGQPDEHSLIPRGWQRSGALGLAFTLHGPAQLAAPSRILCPEYGARTSEHRCHQTVSAIGGRFNLTIETPFPVGGEPQLVETILDPPEPADPRATVLVCWEHHRIPTIAAALPHRPEAAAPQSWDDDRFDLVWRFDRDPGEGGPSYAFTELPQDLLRGDRPRDPVPSPA